MFSFSYPWMTDGNPADAGKAAERAIVDAAAIAVLPATVMATAAMTATAGSLAMMFGWQAVMLRATETALATSSGKSTSKVATQALAVPVSMPVADNKPADDTSVAVRPYGLEAPRGNADDLKRIAGIGPKLEIVLNDLGIYHFDQIAAWSTGEVDWVDDYLKFKGRIARDGWIAQARRLMESVTE